MTPNRPYLLRALFDWILDNHMTPHLLVDAEADDVHVPSQFIDNGKIVLNISPSAVRQLEIGKETVLFSARFGGASFDISVPIKSVLAIYAKENGQGMVFSDEGADEGKVEKPVKNAHLRIVK